jgi:hypothetical protein
LGRRKDFGNVLARIAPKLAGGGGGDAVLGVSLVERSGVK